MDVKIDIAAPNEIHIEEDSPLASVVLEYEDSELASFSRRMDHSLAALKNSLISEYEENRNCFELKKVADNQKKEQDYINKINQLESSLEQERVSLSAAIQKLEMKEKLISNINMYHVKKERKMLMKNAFNYWMDSLDYTKGQKSAMNLANKQYRDSLLRKIVIGWRSVVGISWKTKIEKSIQRDADFRIAVSAKESEDQIKLLQQKISLLERQLFNSQNSIKEKQNEMRSAFLRGVSALNAQAIGIFKDDDQNNEAKKLLTQENFNFPFVDIQKNDKPIFVTAGLASNGTFAKTKGLKFPRFGKSFISRAMPWIFGYGSLIWKADFQYSKKEFGYIEGFVRRFWHGSTDHRGTKEFPGRVVTLIALDEWKHQFQYVDPHPADGIVWGVAYFIDDHLKDEVFQYLDFREKNGYKMVSISVTLQDGTMIDSYLYIAPAHDADFLGPASPEKIAETIVKSVGPSGPNVDYLLNLCNALENVHPNPDYHLCELKRLVLNR